MIDFEHEPSDSPTCKTPCEEEQFLCNEALRTGDFDSMSDREWIALCEQAAAKRRQHVTPRGRTSGSASS